MRRDPVSSTGYGGAGWRPAGISVSIFSPTLAKLESWHIRRCRSSALMSALPPLQSMNLAGVAMIRLTAIGSGFNRTPQRRAGGYLWLIPLSPT